MRFSARQMVAAAVLGLGLCSAQAASAAVIVGTSILDDVTQPGDAIVALSNTGVGGPNVLATEGGGALQYPAGEAPRFGIDNVLTSKYLNFGETSVGFVVTPSFGPSTVLGLRLATGGDAPSRDPITYTLEGSNDPDAAAAGNASWTLISYGLTGLSTDPGRGVFQSDESLSLFLDNASAFTSYRLLFTSVRDGVAANSMQVAEVELLAVVPEPASMGLLAAGALVLAGRRRRR